MQLKDYLRYRNFEYAEAISTESRDANGIDTLPAGQYSTAKLIGDAILLRRDPTGCNKLFFSLDGTNTVSVANRIRDIWKTGTPLDRIYSCPPGHLLRVRGGGVEILANTDLTATTPSSVFALVEFQRALRESLEKAFHAIAHQFQGYKKLICLSGGLDSSVVACLAAQHLDEVAAVCFTYLSAHDIDLAGKGAPPKELESASEDFRHALAVARAIGIKLIPIFRTTDAVGPAINRSVALCQDWRDFNVHCANVNLMIAEGIRARFPQERIVVLTGDLMNEFTCDYRTEYLEGQAYYRVPQIPLDRRRKHFVRGLDTGDREIGVFSEFNIAVAQPFAATAQLYMRIPAVHLAAENAKFELNAHLLPATVARCVSSHKIRAQVGGEDFGTLGTYHRLGIDQKALQKVWYAQFPGESEASCDAVIQFGRYRAFPSATSI